MPSVRAYELLTVDRIFTAALALGTGRAAYDAAFLYAIERVSSAVLCEAFLKPCNSNSWTSWRRWSGRSSTPIRLQRWRIAVRASAQRASSSDDRIGEIGPLSRESH